MTRSAETAGRNAPKKDHAPVICLSTSLSLGGTEIVEAAGYFSALNHLNALTQYDAMRPRALISDLRDTIKKISGALDVYEAALAKTGGEK